MWDKLKKFGLYVGLFFVIVLLLSFFSSASELTFPTYSTIYIGNNNGTIWTLTNNLITPLDSSNTLKIPSLAGLSCIGTDADGDLQSGTCTGGGSSSQFNSSGNNVYLNESSARLGIGTSTPTSALTIVGNATISEKVGIGNTLPNSTLEVSGNINTTTLSVGQLIFSGSQISTNAQNTLQIRNPQSRNIQFATNNIIRGAFDNGGDFILGLCSGSTGCTSSAGTAQTQGNLQGVDGGGTNAIGGNLSISAGLSTGINDSGHINIMMQNGTSGSGNTLNSPRRAWFFNGTSGNFVPANNGTFNIGTPNSKVANIYATNVTSGDLIFANGMVIKESENGLNITDADGNAVMEIGIVGGIRLLSVNKPNCDETHRGFEYNTFGGLGVADVKEICTKTALNSYVWKVINLI